MMLLQDIIKRKTLFLAVSQGDTSERHCRVNETNLKRADLVFVYFSVQYRSMYV